MSSSVREPQEGSTFNSPNRPFTSDQELQVDQLNVSELQTELKERGGAVRVNGKNLRKQQLLEELKKLLESRKRAYEASRRMVPSAEGTSAALRDKLREMEAMKAAAEKKYEEVKRKLHLLEEGKSNEGQSAEGSRRSLMEDLEGRYGGAINSSSQEVVTSEVQEVINLEGSSSRGAPISRLKEAVRCLSQGKSVSFLNSKAGIKWTTEVHEMICACEPNTIPVQFVRALANWDIRVINWSWFLDEEIQEEYDRRASSASFLNRKAQNSILSALLKEKMEAVRDPLFSQMEASRINVPRFLEWERYVRRYGIPLLEKYIDAASGVKVSEKVVALSREMERWVRRDRIDWAVIWEAYATELNIIQKEINRGLCNSDSMARALLHELDLKSRVFDRMIVKARMGSLSSQYRPSKKQKQNPRVANDPRDTILQILEGTPGFSGRLSGHFLATCKAGKHKDRDGVRACFFGCAESWLAKHDGKFRNVKLCHRDKCMFSHKAEECWPTKDCIKSSCTCRIDQIESQRRWQE
jgi:hypothetical protein